MNNGYKISIERRLATLESKLDEVITNHLPHIETKIDGLDDKLDNRLWWFIGMIVSSLITLIISLLK